MINKVFGNSIQNSFKSFDHSSINASDLIGCTASNNGYEKKFGCTHKREVCIDKENNCLKGTFKISSPPLIVYFLSKGKVYLKQMLLY